MTPPFLTMLSYSGGQQSAWLLWRLILGLVEKPERFVAINADPGMEHPETYRYNILLKQHCDAAGIDLLFATGPNLKSDLLNLRASGKHRIDQPPYWTKKANGKRGKLIQKCTKHYKIAPLRRALREYLAARYSIGHELRDGLVEAWIGFAHDEWHRQSDSDVTYIRHRFPFIEDKLTKQDILDDYAKHGIKPPPRSVCNACPYNGLAYYKNLFETAPAAWETAVAIDDNLGALAGAMVDEEAFVSDSLIRLRDLPAMGFGKEREDLSEHHCNSGVCFL
jgi:hypothetical protein